MKGDPLLAPGAHLDGAGDEIVPALAQDRHQQLQRIEIAPDLLQHHQIEDRDHLGDIVIGLAQPVAVTEPVGVEVAQIPGGDQERVAADTVGDLGGELLAQRQKSFGGSRLLGAVHPALDGRVDRHGRAPGHDSRYVLLMAGPEAGKVKRRSTGSTARCEGDGLLGLAGACHSALLARTDPVGR
jgi:hypothetical protein